MDGETSIEATGGEMSGSYHPDVVFLSSNGPSPVRIVRKLVEAGQDLESIFWRQSDPQGLAIYQALPNCAGATEKNIHHYLLINGSRYDLLEGNKPFLANTVRARPRTLSRRHHPQGNR